MTRKICETIRNILERDKQGGVLTLEERMVTLKLEDWVTVSRKRKRTWYHPYPILAQRQESDTR